MDIEASLPIRLQPKRMRCQQGVGRVPEVLFLPVQTRTDTDDKKYVSSIAVQSLSVFFSLS